MGVDLGRIEALFRHQRHGTAGGAATFATDAIKIDVVLGELGNIQRDPLVRERGEADLAAAICHADGLLDGQPVLDGRQPVGDPREVAPAPLPVGPAERGVVGGQDLQGARVVLQGFGNVGSYAGKFLHEMGARVVAVADQGGAVRQQEGLDVPALFAFVRQNRGTVAGFPGGEAFDPATVWAQEGDILIPAALGGVLTQATAPQVRARLIVEGANAPTTPEADRIFLERGITLIPDILANAGGVTVSYFEWVQNLQQLFWDEAEIFEKEEKILAQAFRDVEAKVRQHGCSWRTGALVLALERVKTANELRGW